MGFYSSCLLILLFLLGFCESAAPPTHTFNVSDLQAAMGDMRNRSYYGFVILLQMLNDTLVLNQDATFFIPTDEELSRSSISADHLEEFVLSHSIPMPLQFNDMVHFPTGSLVPSGVHGRLLRIRNHGRSEFFVNNAQVNSPNVCVSSSIKCHGINAVLEYDKAPSHKKRLQSDEGEGEREDDSGRKGRRSSNSRHVPLQV